MNSLYLIPLLPLVGFLINGLWYATVQCKEGAHKAHATVPGVIATLAIFSSFIVSLMTFITLKGMPEEQRMVQQTVFNWFHAGNLNVDFTLRVDVLSTLFTLVITGVGTLIHIYSISYMDHDEAPTKFFAYLNLFCFAMLCLVLGGSLPILFLGWEGVGLCSYLLIGFWYTDPEKASAGKKAFIVNRIGDFGFLLGMFMIFSAYGTLDFLGLKQAVTQVQVNPATITAMCMLLFVGCMGKSAQIPLFVWLPDAMAGPTPVSALIHAATMVTSGIYMLARLNFLFVMSHDALFFIACVGAATAFMAATIAITQTDIKKVLAYSTVSQLGYMFLACGVGAFGAGVFHVITHAFFKALLFLGAGSVIHGMHHEQDIMKMGGLKSKMPKTYLVFMIGWLAICGLPPFSGFFSKDEILWQVFSSEHGSVFLWFVGMVTALMTAFYMTRLFVLTFLGKPRFEEHGHQKDHSKDHDHHAHEVHESPMPMVAPLMILAVLSALGGFMGIPHASWLEHWLLPVVPEVEPAHGINHAMEWVLMAVSALGAAASVYFAFNFYQNLDKAKAMKAKFEGLYKTLNNKWYVDEFYEAVFVKPIHALSQLLWKRFDVGVIDRLVVGLGKGSNWTGQMTRGIQTGSVQVYMFMMLLGLLLSVGYLIYGSA